MKNNFKLFIFLFIMAFTVNAMSQVPKYSLNIKNKVQVSPTRVTFDIVLTHIDATTFEYAAGQYFFKIPMTGFGTFTPGIGANSPYQFDSSNGQPISDLAQAFWPRNPSTGISADGNFLILRLASNVPPGAGSGRIMQQGDSVLIMRMKLTSSTPLNLTAEFLTIIDSCSQIPFSPPGIAINAYLGTTNTSITNCLNHHIDKGTLFLTLIPEGLYNLAGNNLNMNDTVTAYLRSTSAPYAIVDSAKAVLDSLTFTGNFNFTHFTTGTYYIQIKHRNSIETWSKSGVSMNAGAVNYDFTTSPAKAFGDNMKLKGSKYCIYTGDVNQDNIADTDDMLEIFNASSNFAAGYLNSDITGNNLVDSQDLLLAFNNSISFVLASTPIAP